MAFGFIDELLHEEASESFATVGGKHTAYAHGCLRIIGGVEESGVGNDLRLAPEADMRGCVVDVILIEVDDMLLECEDCVARFEDLVKFGSCEVSKGVDVQFDSTWEEYFFFRFACFGSVLLS